MATTYTRRINLYINGREVQNDIASIRAELNKLTARQAHTIRGSAEYNANLLKIRQLREILNQHITYLKCTSRTWGSLAFLRVNWNITRPYLWCCGCFYGVGVRCEICDQSLNSLSRLASGEIGKG